MRGGFRRVARRWSRSAIAGRSPARRRRGRGGRGGVLDAVGGVGAGAQLVGGRRCGAGEDAAEAGAVVAFCEVVEERRRRGGGARRSVILRSKDPADTEGEGVEAE